MEGHPQCRKCRTSDLCISDLIVHNQTITVFNAARGPAVRCESGVSMTEACILDIKFGYDTYQDVRRNLFFYSTPFLVAAGFFAFFFVLPPTHQRAASGFLETISNTQPWKGALGVALGTCAFGFVAFVLTESWIYA
jgi:hypothetical protein